MVAPVNYAVNSQWFAQAGPAWAKENRISYDVFTMPLALLALYQSNATTPDQKEYLKFELGNLLRTSQIEKSAGSDTTNRDKYLQPVATAWDTGQPAYQIYYNIGLNDTKAAQERLAAQQQASLQDPRIAKLAAATGWTPYTPTITQPTPITTTTTPASLIESINAAPIQNKVAGYTPTGAVDTTPVTGGTGNMGTGTPETPSVDTGNWREVPYTITDQPFWKHITSGWQQNTNPSFESGLLNGNMRQWTGSNYIPTPSAQDYYKSMSENDRLVYQSASTGSGENWTDRFNRMQKLWPSWTAPSRFSYTPWGYNK